MATVPEPTPALTFGDRAIYVRGSIKSRIGQAGELVDAEILATIEARALHDAADAIQALHPGEVKNSVVFLRDRAASLLAVAPALMEVTTAGDDAGPDPKDLS